MTPSPFLNPAMAAHYLGLSPSTLSRWRVQGLGPRYRKFGSTVHYAICDLDQYADQAAVVSRGPQPVTHTNEWTPTC